MTDNFGTWSGPRECERKGVEEAICKENKSLMDDIMKPVHFSWE